MLQSGTLFINGGNYCLIKKSEEKSQLPPPPCIIRKAMMIRIINISNITFYCGIETHETVLIRIKGYQSIWLLLSILKRYGHVTVFYSRLILHTNSAYKFSF